MFFLQVFQHAQVQRQSLEPSAPYIASVFKKTETFLGKSEHQNALTFFNFKKSDRYYDIIDYLFCMVFIDERDHCFAFYNGAGLPLRELKSAQEISDMDHIMLKVLQNAYKKYVSEESTFFSALSKW